MTTLFVIYKLKWRYNDVLQYDDDFIIDFVFYLSYSSLSLRYS